MTTTTTTTTTKKNEKCRQLVQRGEALKEAAAAFESAKAQYTAIETEALEELESYGGRTSLTHKGILRILEIETGISVSKHKKIDDEDLCAWARQNGVEIKTQSAQTVAPATIRKAALDGLDVSPVAVVTTTQRINVT